MVPPAGANMLIQSAQADSSIWDTIRHWLSVVPHFVWDALKNIFFLGIGITLGVLLVAFVYRLQWKSRAPYTYPDSFEKKLKIAKAGDALACYQMGELWLKEEPLTHYERKQSRKYYRKAMRLFTVQALNYDPFARFMLGEMYRQRLGLKWPRSFYFQLFQKRLAKVTQRHYYLSRVLYTEKSEHKTADAYRNLAILNENGWGGDSNKVVALDNYKKAADLSDFFSQHKAAHMLYADCKPDEAAHYYLLAAKNPQGATGDAKKAQVDIQMFLGDIYRDGIGRPVSLEEAYFWYSIAASRGKSEAVTERVKLESGMETKMKMAIQGRLKEFHRHLQN